MRPIVVVVALSAALVGTATSGVASACASRDGSDKHASEFPTLDAPCSEDFNPAASVAGVRAELVQRTAASRSQPWSDTGNLLGGVALHGRVSDAVALQLAFDVGAGRTNDGSTRFELDLRPLDILVYLNPQSCTQVYTVVGTTLDFALYSGLDASGATTAQAAMLFGGDFGLGIEHHTSKSRAYSVDARAYMRTGSIDDANGNTLSIVDTGLMVTAGLIAF